MASTGSSGCHAAPVAAERAPEAVGPAPVEPADLSGSGTVLDREPAAGLASPPRARPPASAWVAAGVALAVALVMVWTTAMVGGPLRAECLRQAGAVACAARTGWLDGARVVQVVLTLVAVALLVVTALRRARFVRRSSVLVIVLAVGSFFVAVLMASGGLPQGLLG